jgi:hypothetical protein
MGDVGPLTYDRCYWLLMTNCSASRTLEFPTCIGHIDRRSRRVGRSTLSFNSRLPYTVVAFGSTG